MASIRLLKDRVLNGHLPQAANLAFHIIFLIACALSATLRNPCLHAALAAFAVGFFVLTVALLFSRLVLVAGRVVTQ